tara:strand:- start:3522 stop:5342 length:1821 start_codon:yes stop_codon:yes gene_type:complete
VSYTSLQTGGAVGSKRGGFYEFYLTKLIEKHNFHLDSSNTKTNDDVFYLHYRVPNEEITEIDFHFPGKKVGFWVTNIGLTQKMYCTKCSNPTKKYDEFNNLSGNCPHCTKGNLPDMKKSGYDCWVCSECDRICDPFDLINKKCKKCTSVNFSSYADTSASSQAHKQAYYRIGEYLEVKTSKKNDTLCSEILFNKKKEWRIYGQVLEKFFDSTYFVFENNDKKFGSELFDKKMWEFIDDNLSRKYNSNSFPKIIITYIQNTRNEKNQHLNTWLDGIKKRRKKNWGTESPYGFPIRYSIYTVLKSLGKQNKINPYVVAILQYVKFSKPITSQKMKSAKKICESKGYIKNDELTKSGENYMINAINQYNQIIEKVKNYSGKIHSNDYWLRNRKDLVIQVLERLLDASKKYGWYKFAMVAEADIKELDATPFINTQFEPLETLTGIFLDDFKKEGIIKEYTGLENGDVFEETFLRKVFAVNPTSQAFILGDDAKIELPNGKIVYVQDKSNTSFKKWFERDEITSSGISYKDCKRMIGHNVLTSFQYEKQNLIPPKKNRYYVGIIDGSWSSTKKDLFRMLKAMYTLGVDEIFFADEIDIEFKKYLKKIGST